MNVIETIRGRRAVRDFTDEMVDEAVISGLIESAVQAPSAMNRQAWTFVAVTDRMALARMANEAKAHTLAGMAHTPHLSHLSGALSGGAFDIFYGAPALVVICATSPDDMAVYDCCLAAQNLMLAAHAEGLGSCWIGLAEAWLATPDGRAALGQPDGVRPIAPIILGHPGSRPAAPGRRPASIRWIRGRTA